MNSTRVRHIVNLSGGKDSTALAIYLRDRVPDVEYVFCDTEKELPETYEYLDRLEAYLGQTIERLKHDGRGFDHLLSLYGGFLPSPQARWCTRYLKIRPFELYTGNDPVVSYVGIRADEEREGYISHKPNITPVYPLKEDGITKREVMRILEGSGLGLPQYYKWRSRSGCYFCFFQQKIEWVGLLENHPDLFDRAVSYENVGVQPNQRYTWNPDESLHDLARPERIAQIKAEHSRRLVALRSRRSNMLLMDLVSESDTLCEVVNEYDSDRACLICDL